MLLPRVYKLYLNEIIFYLLLKNALNCTSSKLPISSTAASDVRKNIFPKKRHQPFSKLP